MGAISVQFLAKFGYISTKVKRVNRCHVINIAQLPSRRRCPFWWFLVPKVDFTIVNRHFWKLFEETLYFVIFQPKM